jgi:hypothetical protein
MFFSNLEMKIQKWTFIFVHFSKIQNRFEKTLHHSFPIGHSPFHQINNIFYLSFYKSFFSFYDSKTSKPHASQSYGSGAMRGLSE